MTDHERRALFTSSRTGNRKRQGGHTLGKLISFLWVHLFKVPPGLSSATGDAQASSKSPLKCVKDPGCCACIQLWNCLVSVSRCFARVSDVGKWASLKACLSQVNSSEQPPADSTWDRMSSPEGRGSQDNGSTDQTSHDICHINAFVSFSVLVTFLIAVIRHCEQGHLESVSFELMISEG